MKNTLICGDAAEELKGIPSNSVDLIVTSPPYGTIRKSKDYMDIYDFEGIAKELFRVLKDGGTVCWNEGDTYVGGSRTLTPLRHALYFVDEVGFRNCDHIVYAKKGFSFPSNNRFHQAWEHVFILSKGKQKTFNPIKDRKNLYLGRRGASGRKQDGTRNTGYSEVKDEYGMRFNYWIYATGKSHTTSDNVDHPALMHEGLCEDLILSYSNKGDLVLDPFVGGGTTPKMAKKSGRNYLGIDLSTKYIEMAKKRVKDA
jgi:DNA modification methylase